MGKGGGGCRFLPWGGEETEKDVLDVKLTLDN